MSIVYRGLDTRLDRPVAVKVMDPRFAGDRSFLERFIREARATARLRHPAVVGVHDQGVDRDGPEDRVFLVMELVDGETVATRVGRRGPLDVAESLRIVDEVLQALAAAPRAGIVHPDVKPGHVLPTGDATARPGDRAERWPATEISIGKVIDRPRPTRP